VRWNISILLQKLTVIPQARNWTLPRMSIHLS
jgi:hypothetical protein